jgi:alpha-N-arabinofuranosidase
MYKTHQGARSVRVEIEEDSTARYALATGEARSMPTLSASASLGPNRELTLSVVNAHATLPASATIELRAAQPATAQIFELAHDDLAAHNTFDQPDELRPRSQMIDLPASLRHTFAPASLTVIRTH